MRLWFLRDSSPVAMLVITDLSNCGQDVGGGSERGPHCSPAPIPCQPHPHLDDELSEGLRDDLEQVRGISATSYVEAGHHELSDMVQVPGGSLQGQQDQN